LQAQIVNIPDPNFKNALINTPCVIFGPPGNCEDVNVGVDINGDGEVQVIEAEAVDLLCVSFQNITSLEGIEAFVNLECLYVLDNHLTTIDTSHNLLLKKLNCESNNLSSINISQNTALEVLSASYNELTDIDISNNSNLISLSCSKNQLSSIDITNNINLLGLSIRYNELTAIDLSGHPNFKILRIEHNYLSSIDVSQNPSLSYLDIDSNNISSIDVSNNPLLEFLYVADNNLSTTDVSHNPLLERLRIGGNTISSFDVSNNLLLESFSFSESPLITGDIDLSQHSMLRYLRCENTSISGLNIKNGNNQILNQLKAFNNPNLFCIEVDDAGAINTLWEVDEQVYFSEDCLLGIEDYSITTIVLTPNPVKNSFTITTKLEILSLKIFNLQGKLLYQEDTPNHTLNIASLASGVLLLQFTTDEDVITKKLIKK